MAVVMEMECRGGGRIIVMDDAYRGLPPAELERRRRTVQETAGRILMERARRGNCDSGSPIGLRPLPHCGGEAE